MHKAALSGLKNVAELLLAHKADVNARDSDGKSPLHLAAEAGYKDVVELLLTNGADVNAKDNSSMTPLHFAAQAGHQGVAELLLAQKADAGTEGGRDAAGGVMGITKGLIKEFGEGRVIDTPITELAIMGAAAGAAVTGLRPVAELMFSDFMGVCFDQIFNQAAKFRYMFGGKARTPLVIRTMVGAGRSAAAQHSQSLYHLFTAIPGLKVAVPSNAYDAKGLLIQAIRDDDPVVFCEHKLMYDLKADVPDEAYTIPFGEAAIVREGGDVTIVRVSADGSLRGTGGGDAGPRRHRLRDHRSADDLAAGRGHILESVEHTGRLVVVDEATPRCNMATDIAALVADRQLGH